MAPASIRLSSGAVLFVESSGRTYLWSLALGTIQSIALLAGEETDCPFVTSIILLMVDDMVVGQANQSEFQITDAPAKTLGHFLDQHHKRTIAIAEPASFL